MSEATTSVEAEAALQLAGALRLRRAGHVGRARRLLERLAEGGGAARAPALLQLLDALLAARLAPAARALAERSAPLLRAQHADCFEQLRLRAALMLRLQAPPAPAASLHWLFLRARQQYVNGDLPGAVVTLGQYRQFVDGADRQLWAPLNNNLGVLYSAMKKHNLSVKYMQQALMEHTMYVKNVKNNVDDDEDDTIKTAIAKDRPLYVYNLGISLLKADRPEDAFDCLVEATRHFPNNPRIWLRLAECCVSHHNKSNNWENVARKIGTGTHSKLIPGKFDRDKYSVSGESYAVPTLSLEFAGLCLMNATTLLPRRDPPAEAAYDQGTYLANPCDPMNYKQYCDLRDSASLLYSFVSLRLDDHATALEQASEVLSRQSSPARCVLAHLYSAEALISLDRETEAIEHLNLNKIQIYTAKMSPGPRDVVLFAAWFNSAVCHAVRGDLATARNILLQLNSPRTLPLQLYLETCAGNADNCRLLLRKFKRTNLAPA